MTLCLAPYDCQYLPYSWPPREFMGPEECGAIYITDRARYSLQVLECELSYFEN